MTAMGQQRRKRFGPAAYLCPQRPKSGRKLTPRWWVLPTAPETVGAGVSVEIDAVTKGTARRGCDHAAPRK
jgi:hypothetical protein